MKGLRLALFALGTALLTTSAMAQTELRITHATTGGAETGGAGRDRRAFEAANPDITLKQIVV